MTSADIAATIAALTASDGAWRTLPATMLRSGALRTGLRAAGWYAVTLDRAPVYDKNTLLHALYQSGEFPAYFGFNWDALADALVDFDWVGERKGIALIWRNPALLASRAPDVYAAFGEIVEEAASTRREHGAAPLRILMPAE
jgi:hypothetical protein